MKAIPNYLYQRVSIQELYSLEKRFFGISENGLLLTPNEYCNLHFTTGLDILSGLFYLMWIPVPLGFAAWLFFNNKREYLYFSLTFVLVNLLGFVVYYLYPAAPPWYVQLYGVDFHPNIQGNTAGLFRFDEFFGLPVFQTIYTKGSNVFAAMPSLHSSYPPIVLYYGFRNHLKWRNIPFTVVMLGIWFAAVYTGHHYVLDVIGGIICAISGILVFNALKKTLLVDTQIVRMLRLIS
jgi:inositol phosphorylceramide synthase catalytic subunit